MSYEYFAASLPTLRFGATPPMAVAAFVDAARTNLAADDFAALEAALEGRDGLGFAGAWHALDAQLRNAVARARAESDMRTDFVLDAVGEKLGIQLTNEQFAAYMNNFAMNRRMTREQVKELTSNRVAMRNHFLHARREKVLSELLKTAKPTAGIDA